MVRDLWALKLQTYEHRIGDDDQEGELFTSSQPESLRFHWPRIIDTIGLCYLGALLLRFPVTVAHMHRMVMQGHVPYLRLCRDIPRSMLDKLPKAYHPKLEIPVGFVRALA